MKEIIPVLLVSAFTGVMSTDSYANPLSTFNCKDHDWDSVQTLVQPYLDETLYTALVMQGQSANYNTSAAASQAMDKSLPDYINKTLKAIVDANCS